MPIVNGTYVNDTLPGVGEGQWQQQAFGAEGSKKDWSDSKTAAYNYLLKQQENAYNLELWNLTNKYNSPEEQMKRYMQAGLNPNLIYSQQNTSSPLQAAQNAAFRSQGTHAKSVQNQLSTIQQMQALVQSAAETYDYVKYGAETNRWKMIGAQESALEQKMNNAWLDYMLHGDNMIYGDANRMVNGPKATTYGLQQNVLRNQIDEGTWEIKRLKFMVNSLLPSQEARNQALKALDDYQLNMMQGKFGAILDVKTGLGETVDNWLRLIMFMALARMM